MKEYRAQYVTVWDMFMIGGKINFVVDTEEISGLVFDYNGNIDFETLKKNIQIGQRILIGSHTK